MAALLHCKWEKWLGKTVRLVLFGIVRNGYGAAGLGFASVKVFFTFKIATLDYNFSWENVNLKCLTKWNQNYSPVNSTPITCYCTRRLKANRILIPQIKGNSSKCSNKFRFKQNLLFVSHFVFFTTNPAYRCQQL